MKTIIPPFKLKLSFLSDAPVWLINLNIYFYWTCHPRCKTASSYSIDHQFIALQTDLHNCDNILNKNNFEAHEVIVQGSYTQTAYFDRNKSTQLYNQPAMYELKDAIFECFRTRIESEKNLSCATRHEVESFWKSLRRTVLKGAIKKVENISKWSGVPNA